MLWRSISSSFAIILGLYSLASAQNGTGHLRITLVVPKLAHLTLASSDAAVQYQGGTMANGSQLHLRITGTTTIPLILRSNAPYRVLVRVLTVQGTEQTGIRVSAESVAAAAGGANVMPQATNVQVMAGAITPASDELVVLEGSRISRGGNNSTPDNALMLYLKVDLPEGASEADVLLSMVCN